MRPWPAVAVLLAAVLLAAVLAGCGGSEPAVTTPATRTDAAKPACDGELTGYRTRGKTLRGDVDGDGSADRVSLRADRTRPRACRHLLVAQLGSGATATAPVKALPWPGTNRQLALLAQIDGRAGLEPVVALSPAAVYRPGAVFTMRRGVLARMRLGGVRPAGLFPLHDEFPSGVDCTGERGTIVVTFGNVAQPDTHWAVERSVHRARGTRFERLSTERMKVAVGPGAGRRWPEVRGDPFRSCSPRVD